MRKSSRHIGVLMVLSTLALGLIGAAYALWYEDLQLTANVSTGTFNVDMSMHDPVTHANGTNGVPVVGKPPTGLGTLTSGAATYLEQGDPDRHFTDGAQGYGNFTNANFGAKPQTVCNGELSSQPIGAANDVGDTNVLTLNLGGLYPYAGCEFEIDITNKGTVPMHFAVTSLQMFKCIGPGTGCSLSPTGGAVPWSTGLDPNMPGPQLAACAAWLGNTFGRVLVGGNELHGFNGGTSPGYSGSNQVNLGVTSPLPNNPAIEIGGLSATPLQLHTNESVVCRFKIILDQNAGAEGQNWQFIAKYRAYQWNEAPFGN
ncbi:MAG: hypothetical protein IT302_03010 [Dehalococcoidia bacterium]|nr:hypothetical protein [Dehalococcoidia bacterium]